MYKHYETSDDVFVDREEHIEWMNDALERCKKGSVVLHLKGIGGIGKSSLLNHWVKKHEKSIRLDCYQYSDFFQRLNILAKGAVLQGINLHRFDILWQIRQRFVEGVEPVKEEGRQWAKEVVMAIPFIGSLATIGSAINAVGAKITPKLKGKYGTIGKWLQEQLGKNHIETLLEILWKEPRRAEFLYLSAFLEDINIRDNLNIPILFLFDHFEHVDDEKTLWKFRKKRINETELWTIFLSNLSNCVGVLASRRPAVKGKEAQVEETELLELDRDSCFEMLELQDVTDNELQERIVSVSGGNPFVIDAICDMIYASEVSMSDIESFRADNLAEVRLRVWRRLFSQAEGLYGLINRAGIVPYFDEQIMAIIAPEMTPDSWDRLRHLSFVREREDRTFVLHELAQDLVKAELGGKLKKLALEVSGLLEKASEEKKDYELVGLSLSAQALADDEFDMVMKIDSIIDSLLFHSDTTNALKCLDTLKVESDPGIIHRDIWRGYVLLCAGRISEAEDTTLNVLHSALELTKQGRLESVPYLCMAYFFQARLYQGTGRYYEAEEAFRNSKKILDEFNPQNPRELFIKVDNSTGLYYWLGLLLSVMYRLNEAEKLIRKALDAFDTNYWKPYYSPIEVQGWKRLHQSGLAQVLNYSGKIIEAEKILRTILETCEESVNKPIALHRLY
ncbi:MAG: ATP-binding protein, partial [Candidatus Thorarchaeota archaeon]